jgi:hypothetical protein
MMMNVNLSLSMSDLELLAVSLRLNIEGMQRLANAECLSDDVRAEYRAKLDAVPRILDVLTTLSVKRLLLDHGIPAETFTA